MFVNISNYSTWTSIQNMYLLYNFWLGYVPAPLIGDFDFKILLRLTRVKPDIFYFTKNNAGTALLMQIGLLVTAS